MRPLDSLASARVPGTDGGSGPFWSTDGGSLGYFAEGQLRVVDLRTKEVSTLRLTGVEPPKPPPAPAPAPKKDER